MVGGGGELNQVGGGGGWGLGSKQERSYINYTCSYMF